MGELDLPTLTEAMEFGHYTEWDIMVGVERLFPPKPSEYLTEEDMKRIYYLLHGEDPPFLSYFHAYLDGASSREERIHRARRGYNQLSAKSNGAAARTVRLYTFFHSELVKLGVLVGLVPPPTPLAPRRGTQAPQPQPNPPPWNPQTVPDLSTARRTTGRLAVQGGTYRWERGLSSPTRWS